MATINFLSIDDNNEQIKNQLLRKQAKNILESYNQDWDILSEIFQNAIDAIDQNDNVEQGIIKFVFNQNLRQISIWDNGIGINYIRLKSLNDYINDKNNDFNGIALRNINKRLKLNYGNEYGLEILSILGTGTSMVLTIPYIVK